MFFGLLGVANIGIATNISLIACSQPELYVKNCIQMAATLKNQDGRPLTPLRICHQNFSCSLGPTEGILIGGML